tara:strand:+ start:664 stop:1146 length:483 start_codon:yes stop_codon:yes gene_type:complete
MNYLNGILINPYLKKLTNVNVGTDNTLQDMYKHIGCSMVEVVSFGDVNDLWVDEEALLKRDQRFFKVHNLPFGHHGVIAGRALLLKCGDTGGCESTTLDIHEVTPRISWDFEHNGKMYNSETGLFTEVEFDTSELRKVFEMHEDRQTDIVDSIKSIHVIE